MINNLTFIKLQKKIQLLLSLFKTNKHIQAEILSRKLISNYPKNVFLYNLLGLSLIKQKKINSAIKCYEEAINISSNYAPLYDNLGTAHKLTKNYLKAEYYYKKSIELDGKAAEPQNNLGNLYLLLNKNQEAINCYENAININPKSFLSHYNLGNIFKNTGMFNKAKKHFYEAIKINMFFFAAHRALSELIKYKKNDDHYKILKKIYKNKKNNHNDKTELVFALGKASEDIDNYDDAFFYYSEANKLRKKKIKFSINKEKIIFNRIKNVFNKDILYRNENSSNKDTTAIFILGMPRSGTTLIEQILSSHPKVFGGDELVFIPDLISKYTNIQNNKLFIESLVKFDKSKLTKIGEDYVKAIKELSNNSEKVTDKLPVNFKWIGFIKLILPNAKIIHCVRNSRDNCLSIFKNFFINPELNFAYDLNDLTLYYNCYLDLMKFWKKNLPGFIIDIKYEKLVTNPVDEIRKLINNCNLEWNDSCLKHYNNKRIIKTASDTQARKKIYKDSINSWKNYKKQLEKFFKQLPD